MTPNKAIILNFLNARKGERGEIKADSQTPDMFAFKSSMAKILGFLKSRLGDERAGHDYISRERKGDRWIYTYESKNQNGKEDKRAQAIHHGGSVRNELGPDYSEPYPEYSGKPMDGIKHLLKQKKGFIPNAVTRKDIGGIDIHYGRHGLNQDGIETGFGLKHILARRDELKSDDDITNFFTKFVDTLEKGELHRQGNRIVLVSHKKSHLGKKLTVFLDKDTKNHWVVSSFGMSDFDVARRLEKVKKK